MRHNRRLRTVSRDGRLDESLQLVVVHARRIVAVGGCSPVVGRTMKVSASCVALRLEEFNHRTEVVRLARVQRRVQVSDAADAAKVNVRVQLDSLSIVVSAGIRVEVWEEARKQAVFLLRDQLLNVEPRGEPIRRP